MFCMYVNYFIRQCEISDRRIYFALPYKLKINILIIAEYISLLMWIRLYYDGRKENVMKKKLIKTTIALLIVILSGCSINQDNGELNTIRKNIKNGERALAIENAKEAYKETGESIYYNIYYALLGDSDSDDDLFADNSNVPEDLYDKLDEYMNYKNTYLLSSEDPVFMDNLIQICVTKSEGYKSVFIYDTRTKCLIEEFGGDSSYFDWNLTCDNRIWKETNCNYNIDKHQAIKNLFKYFEDNPDCQVYDFIELDNEKSGYVYINFDLDSTKTEFKNMELYCVDYFSGDVRKM